MKSLEPDPWQEELPFQEGASGLRSRPPSNPLRGLCGNDPWPGRINPYLGDLRPADYPSQTGTQPGETVTVKILEIDRDRQRVSLSLKAASSPVNDPKSELSETRTGDVIRRSRRPDESEDKTGIHPPSPPTELKSHGQASPLRSGLASEAPSRTDHQGRHPQRQTLRALSGSANWDPGFADCFIKATWPPTVAPPRKDRKKGRNWKWKLLKLMTRAGSPCPSSRS